MPYIKHENITKEILDTVKVGDYIKINDWKRGMKVRGVSANYFVMSVNAFGKPMYSICEKKPWGGIRHNAMTGGMFHCGTDSWIFGAPDLDSYMFDDEAQTAAYLESFERGESELSPRRAVPILTLEIKQS